MSNRGTGIVRLAIIVVSIVGLVGLCVHYAATYDDRWPYPTSEQLDEEYASPVGEDALVFGEVREVGDDRMVIELEETDGVDPVLTVDEAPDNVETGGFVQVYGTLEGDQQIEASEVAVIDRNPGDFLYKLAVSAVGLLFVAGYFLWHWRASLRPFGWEVRSRG